MKRLIAQLRVYTISDQDHAGPWMRREFPGLFYIVSPSTPDWREYWRATWTGIGGDVHYGNGPGHKFHLVDNPWLEENIIQNHGPAGSTRKARSSSRTAPRGRAMTWLNVRPRIVPVTGWPTRKGGWPAHRQRSTGRRLLRHAVHALRRERWERGRGSHLGPGG